MAAEGGGDGKRDLRLALDLLLTLLADLSLCRAVLLRSSPHCVFSEMTSAVLNLGSNPDPCYTDLTEQKINQGVSC